MQQERQAAVLQRIALEEPLLAARLVVMCLPAAAARIPGRLAYGVEVEGLGSYRVTVDDGRAQVADAVEGEDTEFDLRTDPRTLVDLALGRSSPMSLMLNGRVRISGNRRRALKLRRMVGAELGLARLRAVGGRIDPDVLHHALPHLVEPGWTEGHRFRVRYVVGGPGGGSWTVHVRDGEPLEVGAGDEREVAATLNVTDESYQRIAAGEISPAEAIQRQLTTIDGALHPLTLMARWIARGQGDDEAELRRESDQRELQGRRGGDFAIQGAHAGQGDPGHLAELTEADSPHDTLLDYRQLYALWERRHWSVAALDFGEDREHWLVTPREGQESTIWSLGSFYVGEERVTAALAPFLLAAPTGEIELCLAAQVADEARHAAFFDRFGAEVMCLASEDLRGRMREVDQVLPDPWRELFDDGLRDLARRLAARPDDLELFVEGIATCHLVVEGFLTVTGQTLIGDFFAEHAMYPGFCEGLALVERDEHRHVAFGVRVLRDAIDRDPRYRRVVERTVAELVPRAARIFAPPYAEDASEYASYGYTSREIYGLAYRTLRRRMRVLGIEVPPAEELMPGPVDDPGSSPAEPATEAPVGLEWTEVEPARTD